jgi:acetyl esterase/lipase
MDVAYRMARETDMQGMLDDVKRAVAWLKAHGPGLGVDPDRVVLAGGSAGGHLALLSAYTAGQAGFASADVAGTDLSVCGYLPWSKLVMRLFGGPLEEVGDAMLAYSPIAHVGAHCPPTLILQGTYDHVIPVEDVDRLHTALDAAGCRAMLVKLPQVEHAFDLFALQISPPAQAALYDVDRFLAWLAR